MWITLAILLLILLAVLLLPLGMEVASAAGVRRWYLILAGLHIPVPKPIIERARRRMRQKYEKQEVSKRKSIWQDLAGKLRGLRSKQRSQDEGFRLNDLRTTLDTVIRILHILRIRVHRLHIVIASPDPAWTGVAYGMACAAIGALPPEWPVSVEADWSGNVPQFTYRVEVSVVPVRALAVLTGFLWRRAFA
jgi:hypothetical protein